MDTDPKSRARLTFAVGLTAVFAILVVVIVVAQSGSGEEREFVAAPPECIQSWNQDSETASLGQHQAVAHSYSLVEVAYATADGSEVASERIPGGSCVLLFAASQLDSEVAAAALIERRSGWEPLSGTGVEPERLDELQDRALDAANAELGDDGRLTPL